MNFSGLNSLTIYKDQPLILTEISSLTISNYSDLDLDVTISNVTRTIPAFDATLKVPYVFTIDGDGTFADIELQLKYNGNVKNGYAIVDYRKRKQC